MGSNKNGWRSACLQNVVERIMTNQGPETLNILVCEYKTYNQEAIRRILESRGHCVTLTASLNEALSTFLERPQAYDLLLIDVIPPPPGADSECKADLSWVPDVRAAQPSIGLLLASGYFGERFQPPASSTYLMKPFTSDELAEAVAQAMRAAPAIMSLPKAA